MSLYHLFHDRFGTAGVVIGVIAMIVALTGSAFAAGGGLGGKQKKEVKAIAKSFAGKPGAPGAPGTAGTNGTNGKDGVPGADGQDGAPGAPGKSVAVGTASATDCPNGSPKGGVSVEVEGSGAKKFACNGKEGSPWTAGGTLLSEKTETGAWSVPNGGTSTTISFPIPLGAEIADVNTHYVTTPGGSCTGTSADPTAAAGHLCVYKTSGGTYSGVVMFKPGTSVEFFPGVFVPEEGASKTGAIISSNTAASEGAAGFVSGTFAVTAP